MNDHGARKFLPILMESPLFTTLSLEERQELLQRLTENYPGFKGDADDQSKDDN